MKLQKLSKANMYIFFIYFNDFVLIMVIPYSDSQYHRDLFKIEYYRSLIKEVEIENSAS